MSFKKTLLISSLALCASSVAIAAAPAGPTPVYDQGANTLLSNTNATLSANQTQLQLLNNNASTLNSMFKGDVPILDNIYPRALQNITLSRLAALNSAKNSLNNMVGTQVIATKMPANAPNIALIQLQAEKSNATSLLNKNQLKNCSGTIAGTSLLKDCSGAKSVDPETYLLNFTNYITPSINMTTGEQDSNSLTPQQKSIMAPVFLKYAAESYASLDGGLDINKLNDLNKADRDSITQSNDYKEMDTNKSTAISRTSIALANLAYVINSHTPPKCKTGHCPSLDSSLQEMAGVNLLPSAGNPLYDPNAKPVQVEKAILATMGTIAYELYQQHLDNERIIANGALSSLQLSSADRMNLLAKTSKINQQIMQKAQAEKQNQQQ